MQIIELQEIPATALGEETFLAVDSADGVRRVSFETLIQALMGRKTGG